MRFLWALLKRIPRVFVVGGLLATVVLPLNAQPIEIRDDRGKTIRFDSPPRRIVSLLPSLTETLCALGACERLVAVDRHSNYPVAIASLPRLGGLEDLQVENLVKVRPDVVIAARSTRAVDRIEQFGIAVAVFDSDRHEDFKRSLEALANLIGRPERALSLWASIQQQIEAAQQSVPAAVRGERVYFEIGSTPYAAGPNSFIGQTLGRLGMDNIVAASGTALPFPKLNPEFVLRSRPDWIMAPEREIAAMPQRPGWSALSTPAHRRCGYSPADYDILVRPGPRLGEAARLLARCLSQGADRGSASSQTR